MPKRQDINKILIIGAGPIVIGQACEFDYSGAQACKSLKEEGYKVVLVNSNPATIMTDPDLSDKTYIEPITKEFVEQIIELEKPDALLPTMGGQTALNVSMELAKSGILKKNNVKMIGANPDAIELAEDRQKFKDAMREIGLKCPESVIVEELKKEGVNTEGIRVDEKRLTALVILGIKNQNVSLEGWAKQGVLLLNSYLSVREGEPLSHAKIGWEIFTNRVLIEASRKCNIVFMLWGSYARSKKDIIEGQNLILEATHPSPLSAHKGFLGCKHFSKANAYLDRQGIKQIDWQLA